VFSSFIIIKETNQNTGKLIDLLIFDKNIEQTKTNKTNIEQNKTTKTTNVSNTFLDNGKDCLKHCCCFFRFCSMLFVFFVFLTKNIEKVLLLAHESFICQFRLNRFLFMYLVCFFKGMNFSAVSAPLATTSLAVVNLSLCDL